MQQLLDLIFLTSKKEFSDISKTVEKYKKEPNNISKKRFSGISKIAERYKKKSNNLNKPKAKESYKKRDFCISNNNIFLL